MQARLFDGIVIERGANINGSGHRNCTKQWQAQPQDVGCEAAHLLCVCVLARPYVVALWEAFYIETKRFDLDTLRMPNRSPTRISKFNDSPGQSDDIRGARGCHFRPSFGVPGVRAGLEQNMF